MSIATANGPNLISQTFPVCLPGSTNTVDWVVYNPSATIPWSVANYQPRKVGSLNSSLSERDGADN